MIIDQLLIGPSTRSSFRSNGKYYFLPNSNQVAIGSKLDGFRLKASWTVSFPTRSELDGFRGSLKLREVPRGRSGLQWERLGLHLKGRISFWVAPPRPPICGGDPDPPTPLQSRPPASPLIGCLIGFLLNFRHTRHVGLPFENVNL